MLVGQKTPVFSQFRLQNRGIDRDNGQTYGCTIRVRKILPVNLASFFLLFPFKEKEACSEQVQTGGDIKGK